MNKFKKEQQRKFSEARKGLSAEQIEKLDEEDKIKEKVEALAKKIHVEKFPEEYDFMYDSNVDVSNRSKGINPMSKEYIDKVREKREKQGVLPLSLSGLSVSEDSLELCGNEAKQQIVNQ